MPLFDQHLHSRHSFDSRADPAANVEAAIAAGLAGLTFTEHYDTHPDDWPDCVYDDKAYTATIESLRHQYGNRIFIGKGIEVCGQLDQMDDIVAFLKVRTFDVVLLSVHYFDGRPLHRREAWNGIAPAEGTRRYLESVLRAVRFCETLHRRHGRVFDVLGHLDLVKRYTQRFFGVNEVGQCPELIDEILTACVAADIVPEINTSTLRQGLNEPMPGPTTVQRYAALGGTAMSLGSDAHRSQDIGAGFEHATEILRQAGVEHMAVFQNRQRVEVPLAPAPTSTAESARGAETAP